MTKTLRALAAEQLDAFTAEYGAPADREQAIDRWMRNLIETGNVPDDILEALPEVSRHNEPQIAPQEYECGCVAMTRITGRDCRTWRGYDEKPFEMRLAIPCSGEGCELPHLREAAK